MKTKSHTAIVLNLPFTPAQSGINVDISWILLILIHFGIFCWPGAVRFRGVEYFFKQQHSLVTVKLNTVSTLIDEGLNERWFARQLCHMRAKYPSRLLFSLHKRIAHFFVHLFSNTDDVSGVILPPSSGQWLQHILLYYYYSNVNSTQWSHRPDFLSHSKWNRHGAFTNKTDTRCMKCFNFCLLLLLHVNLPHRLATRWHSLQCLVYWRNLRHWCEVQHGALQRSTLLVHFYRMP